VFFLWVAERVQRELRRGETRFSRCTSTPQDREHGLRTRWLAGLSRPAALRLDRYVSIRSTRGHDFWSARSTYHLLATDWPCLPSTPSLTLRVSRKSEHYTVTGRSWPPRNASRLHSSVRASRATFSRYGRSCSVRVAFIARSCCHVPCPLTPAHVC